MIWASAPRRFHEAMSFSASRVTDTLKPPARPRSDATAMTRQRFMVSQRLSMGLLPATSASCATVSMTSVSASL